MSIRPTDLLRTIADVLCRWLHKNRPDDRRGESTSALTFIRSVCGPDLLDTPGDQTFALCARGYASSFVDDVIRSYDREFLFLDIGANLGLFSLLADCHPLCRRVLAFEPLPRSSPAGKPSAQWRVEGGTVLRRGYE
jgi:hypothetical protein